MQETEDVWKGDVVSELGIVEVQIPEPRRQNHTLPKATLLIQPQFMPRQYFITTSSTA